MILDIIDSLIDESISKHPDFEKLSEDEKSKLKEEYYNKLFRNKSSEGSKTT